MEKVIRCEDRRIAYEINGSGRAVVLLHGFLENRHIWDFFVSQLKKNHQVISIDLPGFGNSEVIAEIHTMELMADIVKQVVDAEQISDFVIVGHSMGGYVAAAFAEKYETSLSGLVLFHSHLAADSDVAKQNRIRTIDLVKKNKKDFIAAFIPALFANKNVSLYHEEIALLQQTAIKISAESVIAALAGMGQRSDHQITISGLQVPVLFIVGKEDSRISMETIVPQLTIPIHSEALILDGVGHMGFIEAREKTYSVLESFINRVNN